MSKPTNAEKHAKIAKAAWADKEWDTSAGECEEVRDGGTCIPAHVFDLLATNPDGTPTTQAKADAMDMLVWIKMTRPHLNLINWFHKSETEYDGWQICSSGSSASIGIPGFIYQSGATPCEAIFNAAYEVVK